jgi:hypothetical protein
MINIGPSDSEGAVIKCSLRRQELIGHYMATSRAVFDWLQENLSKSTEVYDDLSRKHRHSIHSRIFVFVPVGDINHLGLPDVAGVEVPTKSMFCFDSADCKDVELALSELSGDFCDACFTGKNLCPNKSRVGEIVVELNLKPQGCATTRSAAAQKHLLERGSSLIETAEPLQNVMVVFDRGTVLEPMQLVDAKVLHGNKVAVYCAYDSNEAKSTFQFNELASCGKKPEVCGLHSTPPCYKRHVQTIPITSLRPPVFNLVEKPSIWRGDDALRTPEELSSRSKYRETHRFERPEEAFVKAQEAINADLRSHDAAVLY